MPRDRGRFEEGFNWIIWKPISLRLYGYHCNSIEYCANRCLPNMFMIICVLNMNQISFALPKLPPAPFTTVTYFFCFETIKMLDLNLHCWIMQLMSSFKKLQIKIGKIFFSIFSDTLLYYDNNFAYLTRLSFCELCRQRQRLLVLPEPHHDWSKLSFVSIVWN